MSTRPVLQAIPFTLAEGRKLVPIVESIDTLNTLAIRSIDTAVEPIIKTLARDGVTVTEDQARNLAWVLGFDCIDAYATSLKELCGL